jgi:hypothetical protein
MLSARNGYLVAIDSEAVIETLRGPFHVTHHVFEAGIARAQDFWAQLPTR